MKCTEPRPLWRWWFESYEHDWRIIGVHTTYYNGNSKLEEVCRLCKETRIRRTDHTTDFWLKIKSEQPEK